ncbi:MAG: sigma-70 family RNA polymerase sigma factor [Patescibacteria group bacterium]
MIDADKIHGQEEELAKEFGKIYDQYIKKIYNFVYYKTHHKETAEDLASVTFAKAWERFNTFDQKKGFVSAWLYKIARNTVIDHYRAQKFEYDVDDVWDLSGNEDIPLDTETKLKLEEVRKHIKFLNSSERDILIMRVWQELSYKEIAEILGKSEASCKMAFSRALARLKKRIPLAAVIAFFLFSSLD